MLKYITIKIIYTTYIILYLLKKHISKERVRTFRQVPPAGLTKNGLIRFASLKPRMMVVRSSTWTWIRPYLITPIWMFPYMVVVPKQPKIDHF